MSPIKEILLGSVVGIGLGLLIGFTVPHYEVVDPQPKQQEIIVWEGIIAGQEVVITQKEIESY